MGIQACGEGENIRAGKLCESKSVWLRILWNMRRFIKTIYRSRYSRPKREFEYSQLEKKEERKTEGKSNVERTASR